MAGDGDDVGLVRWEGPRLHADTFVISRAAGFLRRSGLVMKTLFLLPRTPGKTSLSSSPMASIWALSAAFSSGVIWATGLFVLMASGYWIGGEQQQELDS